jgi:hypothetical protein
MIVKKVGLLFIFQILFIGYNMSQDTLNGNVLINDMLVNRYELFFTKDKIDRALIKKLKRDRKVDLSMVNPNEEFNKTDMVIKGFPNKRLIFVGKGQDHSEFLFYENGGNALYNICLIYRKSKKNHYETVGPR